MPRPLPEDKQTIIINALNNGLSRTQIAHVVGVSKRAITRISTNLKKHGSAKPPPSGLKLGRPVRLTRVQVEAMMGWMREREYVFYVKDLVAYLRERHGYEGCDGTVRRGLLRSGFRKRLPWHKSEVTAWVPPEGDVAVGFEGEDEEEMDVDGKDDDGAQEEGGDAAATEPEQNEQAPAPNIDPQLDLEQHVAAALSQLPNSLSSPENARSKNVTGSTLLSHASHPQTALPRGKKASATTSPSKPVQRKKKQTAANGSVETVTASSGNAPTPTPLENQLSAMQSQLAQQQDLIAKLQQQLAAAQQAAPVVPPSQSSTLLAHTEPARPIPHAEEPDAHNDQGPPAASELQEHDGESTTDAEADQGTYEIQYEVRNPHSRSSVYGYLSHYARHYH